MQLYNYVCNYKILNIVYAHALVGACVYVCLVLWPFVAFSSPFFFFFGGGGDQITNNSALYLFMNCVSQVHRYGSNSNPHFRDAESQF